MRVAGPLLLCSSCSLFLQTGEHDVVDDAGDGSAGEGEGEGDPLVVGEGEGEVAEGEGEEGEGEEGEGEAVFVEGFDDDAAGFGAAWDCSDDAHTAVRDGQGAFTCQSSVALACTAPVDLADLDVEAVVEYRAGALAAVVVGGRGDGAGSHVGAELVFHEPSTTTMTLRARHLLAGNEPVPDVATQLLLPNAERVRLRVRITGATRIEASAWPDGEAAPPFPQVTAEDEDAPRAAGRLFVSGFAFEDGVEVVIDDVVVRRP